MIARVLANHSAAALKYDLPTMPGVIGLGGASTLQRSMIRLMTLVTARCNMRSGEMTVGRRETARLWGVDERTIKREVARLRDTGLLVLRRTGGRGRVLACGIDFDAVRAA